MFAALSCVLPNTHSGLHTLTLPPPLPPLSSLDSVPTPTVTPAQVRRQLERLHQGKAFGKRFSLKMLLDAPGLNHDVISNKPSCQSCCLETGPRGMVYLIFITDTFSIWERIILGLFRAGFSRGATQSRNLICCPASGAEDSILSFAISSCSEWQRQTHITSKKRNVYWVFSRFYE